MNPRVEQDDVQDADGYLDIRDIGRLFWSGRYIVLFSAIFFGGIATLIALTRPDVYTSEALVRPAEKEGASAQNLGILSSLGPLSRFGLSDTNSGADFAVAVLQSRKFLTDFAHRHDIVPELVAAESWDAASAEIRYDRALFSPENRDWVRDVAPPLRPEPNEAEIYSAFRSILDIDRDQESGFIRVSIEFVSPVLARAWIDQLLADLNEEIRRQAIDELDKSIGYLREKLEEATIADVRASLADLLQHQIRDRMLTNSRAEYALETIDPAYVADFKSGPPRVLMIIAGGMLGGLFGVLVVLVYHGLRPSGNSS